MPNEILTKYGTAIVWADTTDYSSTVSGLARTDQLDLTSVAPAAARQGAKKDLGATRARQYAVLVGFEIGASAASDENIIVYWGGSPSATAANANPGQLTGADADYTGTTGDTLMDSLKQLEEVGPLVTTSDNTTDVQYGQVGVLTDIPRYGMPVVLNNSTGSLVGDAVEMYVALIPLIDEVQ
jgi:hypothetical protein